MGGGLGVHRRWRGIKAALLLLPAAALPLLRRSGNLRRASRAALFLPLAALLLAAPAGCAVVTSGVPIEPEPALIEWERTFGGAGPDSGHAVRQLADGGFIIAGQSYVPGAGDSAYLLRTGSAGQSIWQRHYAAGARSAGYAVLPAAGGGFVAAGQLWAEAAENSDLYLFKTDEDGILLWERSFGGAASESGQYLLQAADGSYLATGWTESAGPDRAAYLIKVDREGRLLWERSFGLGEWTVGQHILKLSGGGYLVTGWTETGEDGAGGRDVYAAALNSEGELLWEQSFGGADDEIGMFARQEEGGELLIAGQYFSYATGGTNLYLVRADAAGELLSEQHAATGGNHLGLALFPALDGGFLMLGQLVDAGGYRSIALAVLEPSGEQRWMLFCGGHLDDAGLYAIELTGGGYLITGWTESFDAGNRDLYLAKLKTIN